jgi:hypothetical protein
MLRVSLFAFMFFSCAFMYAQKYTYDVMLFGKKIGQTTVERIERADGEVLYKLRSSSEAQILFTKKTSEMLSDVMYKDGIMWSSYVKNVKDGVTEVVKVIREKTQYVIDRGEEVLKVSTPVKMSSILLYYQEPHQNLNIFSERLGRFCEFKKTAEGVYECKLDNGVNNIYKYRNGVLYELEMVKGASVTLKLVP